MFPIFIHLECNCNSVGSKDEICNERTGECSCKLGFTGTNCKGCAIGYTGNTCNECVPGYDNHGGYPNCIGKLFQGVTRDFELNIYLSCNLNH